MLVSGGVGPIRAGPVFVPSKAEWGVGFIRVLSSPIEGIGDLLLQFFDKRQTRRHRSSRNADGCFVRRSNPWQLTEHNLAREKKNRDM